MMIIIVGKMHPSNIYNLCLDHVCAISLSFSRVGPSSARQASQISLQLIQFSLAMSVVEHGSLVPGHSLSR